MTPVRIRGMQSVVAVLWIGLLTVVMTVIAGPTHAQPPTPPQEPAKIVADEPRRAVANDSRPQPQPATVIANQTQNVPNVAKTQSASTKSWLLEEVTTGFLIVMLSVGGVTVMAVATRFYFRLLTPTDPVKLALTDPWVLAHLADPAPSAPAEAPAEPDASVPGE